MPLFSIPDIKLCGMAAAVPEFEYNNNNYDWVPDSERKLLIKTIGVEKRRIAQKGTATSDLCFVAAEKLIEELHWDKNEIQALILVSQTFDYQIPSTAIIMQDRMGLPKSCIAFDINLGCSGFVYGLSVIGSIMKTAGIKKAILLTGDVSTLNASYQDKSVYPLFGDAGTATALELSPGAPSMHFHLNSDGSGHKAIYVQDGGMRNFVNPESLIQEKIAEGIIRSRIQISLNGYEVFQFSLREVAPNVNALMAYQNKTVDDFDFFIFHQANLLMNETIRKKIKIPSEKYPYSINKYGNTSSASVPLTIISELKEQVTKERKLLLVSGFGVGLSWGSAIIETDKIICPDIITYHG
ncbi:MAG: hypothetical protein A2W91_01900 [Bacteroidetes bacterium GWF2_38_335]|nr:MAG: hypothetical protein A2W91_01900 [Bacteroidetes bacterium GWF2_38_335]OFY78821.1 MAG: hypothetical protein A2281_19475 [Bacteroidetes bacterium RIFOXYA12_FULL_38_20]HBS85218.1 ketoacyl-ACP synthase III [Bacteroidales bacterium]